MTDTKEELPRPVNIGQMVFYIPDSSDWIYQEAQSVPAMVTYIYTNVEEDPPRVDLQVFTRRQIVVREQVYNETHTTFGDFRHYRS